MKIFNFLILMGLVFFNYSTLEAKGIPYCSKKINTGCVIPQPGQSAKTYTPPKYKVKSASAKIKKNSKQSVKQKKFAKSTVKNKKSKSAKRKIASTSKISVKKIKSTKSKSKKSKK